MGNYDGENMMKAGEKNKWADLYIFEFKNERRSETKRHFCVNFESLSRTGSQNAGAADDQM